VKWCIKQIWEGKKKSGLTFKSTPRWPTLIFESLWKKNHDSQNVADPYLRALGNLGSHVGRKLYSRPSFAQTHILLVGDAIVHPRHMQSTSSPRGLPALVAWCRVTHDVVDDDDDDRNLNPNSGVANLQETQQQFQQIELKIRSGSRSVHSNFAHRQISNAKWRLKWWALVVRFL
jgi:hypothetical protein